MDAKTESTSSTENKAADKVVQPQNSIPDETEFLTTIVNQLFEPGSEAGGSNTFDYISLADALNSVRENVECDMQTLYTLMIGLGFTTRTIDGVIYWIVKTN